MYVLPAAPIVSLSVAGVADRFPVNRIFCVGRNYAEHAREMGKDPEREPPFFFMKPASAAVDAAQPIGIAYPPRTKSFHHEVELVAAIGRAGAAIPVSRALEHVFGYAVGLDMTRRDLQLEARDKGRPWELGKSFAQSAPIGAVYPTALCGHIHSGAIGVQVDGVQKQLADVSRMIWSVAECIASLSQYEALQPGDLLMTGTPAGVGPVSLGSTMRGEIDGLGQIVVQVRPQEPAIP